MDKELKELFIKTIKDNYGYNIDLRPINLGLSDVCFATDMVSDEDIIYYNVFCYGVYTKEMIETLAIHEGRHLWQKKNKLKGFGSLDAKNKFFYYFNPIELDAVCSQINFKKGKVSKIKKPTIYYRIALLAKKLSR